MKKRTVLQSFESSSSSSTLCNNGLIIRYVDQAERSCCLVAVVLFLDSERPFSESSIFPENNNPSNKIIDIKILNLILTITHTQSESRNDVKPIDDSLEMGTLLLVVLLLLVDDGVSMDRIERKQRSKEQKEGKVNEKAQVTGQSR